MEQEKDWFETEDLLLYMAHWDLAQEVTDFYVRNREFLAPFEPKRPESFYTVKGQKQELREEPLKCEYHTGSELALHNQIHSRKKYDVITKLYDYSRNFPEPGIYPGKPDTL